MDSARLQVERACALLGAPSPAALDRSAALLESAASLLALPGAVSGGGRLEDALRLRAAIHCAGALLLSAGAYHSGWSRLMASICGGYTPDGKPAEAARSGRLSLEA